MFRQDYEDFQCKCGAKRQMQWFRTYFSQSSDFIVYLRPISLNNHKKVRVPKSGVRPEPVPIGSETGRHRKTVGQINPVFATLIFQGHVWNTVGQRDTGTKIEAAAFSDGRSFFGAPLFLFGLHCGVVAHGEEGFPGAGLFAVDGGAVFGRDGGALAFAVG